MRAIFHTLLIWLMLLAVPGQGFAAATMLMCEPVVVSLHASAAAHDHAAMLEARASDQPDQPGSSSHHTAGKCSSCAAFCLGLVMMTSSQPGVPTLDFPSQHDTVSTSRLTSVIPEHPERPPQALLA
jgi:hypothetical protein